MHPVISQLAHHFGVKLSERVCYSVERGLPEDFQPEYASYNGNDIALQIRFRNQVQERDDHSLMHEIAHYVVAAPEQRDLPEFGLGTVLYGKPLMWTGRWDNNAIPAVVEESESVIQEHMAQFLCVLWGKSYGVSPRMLENPDYTDNWDQYFALKTYGEMESFMYRKLFNPQDQREYYELATSQVWKALIRLQEMDLLKLP